MAAIHSSSGFQTDGCEEERFVFTVRPPVYTVFVGLGYLAFFLFLLVYAAFFVAEPPSAGVYVFFTLFILLGAVILLRGLTWRLAVGQRSLRLASWPWKSETVPLSAVTRVKSTGRFIIVYADGRRLFAAEITYVGYRLLVERLMALGIPFIR